MPRENPKGNLPFQLWIAVRPSGCVRDRIGGFRHIKSQNFGRIPLGILAGQQLEALVTEGSGLVTREPGRTQNPGRHKNGRIEED